MKAHPTILRERISLVAVHRQEKADGTWQETSTELATVWADVRALPPAMGVDGDGWGKTPLPTVFYRVRIRHQPLAFHRIDWRKKCMDWPHRQSLIRRGNGLIL